MTKTAKCICGHLPSISPEHVKSCTGHSAYGEEILKYRICCKCGRCGSFGLNHEQAIESWNADRLENHSLQFALKWYKERAEACAKFDPKKTDARYVEAIFTELSLDGGRRAKYALGESHE